MISRTVVRALTNHSYEFVDYLSKGGFGSCYLIKSTKFDITFVCKVMRDQKEDKSFILSYKREVEALIQLDHPNIVRIYDVFTEKKYLFIILEYCSAGNISSVLTEKKRLSAQTVFRLSSELIDALEYMHSHGFAHYDIKAENVLIDQYGRVKLADFGLTEQIDENKKTISSKIKGSLNYMAPEILQHQDHDPFKADVWALGVTLYFIATNRLPFIGGNNESVLQEIGIGYDKFRKIPREIKKLIDICLVVDINKRATMKQVKEKCELLSKSINDAAAAKMTGSHNMARYTKSALLFKPMVHKRLSGRGIEKCPSL